LVRGKVLGVAMTLARPFAKNVSGEKRSGVVLRRQMVLRRESRRDPCRENSVNLTSPVARAIDSATEQAGLRTTITAHAMAQRLEGFHGQRT